LENFDIVEKERGKQAKCLYSISHCRKPGTSFIISIMLAFYLCEGPNIIRLLKLTSVLEQRPEEISNNSKMKRRVTKVGDRKEVRKFSLINNTA